MIIQDWKKDFFTIPNWLSLFRLLLIPVYVVIYLNAAEPVDYAIAAAILAVSCLTDAIDGKIARKYNLITDFGKFIDPLADKFMIIGSQIAILAHLLIRGEITEGLVFVWVVLIILLRELAVTSIRLVVAGKSGIVVAASIFGKIKTVSQIVGTLVIILEPLVFPFFAENHIAAYIAMGVMCFTTIFSGLDYLKAYLPYIDSNK